MLTKIEGIEWTIDKFEEILRKFENFDYYAAKALLEEPCGICEVYRNFDMDDCEIACGHCFVKTLFGHFCLNPRSDYQILDHEFSAIIYNYDILNDEEELMELEMGYHERNLRKAENQIRRIIKRIIWLLEYEKRKSESNGQS